MIDEGPRSFEGQSNDPLFHIARILKTEGFGEGAANGLARNISKATRAYILDEIDKINTETSSAFGRQDKVHIYRMVTEDLIEHNCLNEGDIVMRGMQVYRLVAHEIAYQAKEGMLWFSKNIETLVREHKERNRRSARERLEEATRNFDFSKKEVLYKSRRGTHVLVRLETEDDLLYVGSMLEHCYAGSELKYFLGLITSGEAQLLTIFDVRDEPRPIGTMTYYPEEKELERILGFANKVIDDGSRGFAACLELRKLFAADNDVTI